jgi:hypothetical protein
VVALNRHPERQNQAVNRGERGAVAWFEDADRRCWTFAVRDDALDQPGRA